MLLVIVAQTAVVRAAPFDRCVVMQGHFRFLDEHFAAAPVIIDVIRDEHSFGTVFRAALQQKHFVVLKDNFAFQLAETRRANRQCNVIKHVRPHAFRHFVSCSGGFLNKRTMIATKSQIAVPTTNRAPTTASSKKKPFEESLCPS